MNIKNAFKIWLIRKLCGNMSVINTTFELGNGSTATFNDVVLINSVVKGKEV